MAKLFSILKQHNTQFFPILALFFVAGVSWIVINPEAFLVRPELWLDTWIYLGYANFGKIQYEMFPSTYYGSRLSYILPVHILKTFLGIESGLRIYKFSIFLSSIMSVWYIGKIISNSLNGFLAGLILFFYTAYYTEFFYDHPTGFGVSFVLIALAFLFKEKKWGIALSGIFFCLAVHANLIFILYLIFPSLFFLLENKKTSKKLLGCAILMISFLTTNLILGCGGHFIGAGFNFYYPSFFYALNSTNWETTKVWVEKGWSWIFERPSTQLIILGQVALLLKIFNCSSYKNHLRTNVFFLGCLIISGLYISAQLFGVTGLLNIPYYCIHLAPFSCLAIFSIINNKSEKSEKLPVYFLILLYAFYWNIIQDQRSLLNYIFFSLCILFFIQLYFQQTKLSLPLYVYLCVSCLIFQPSYPFAQIPKKERLNYLKEPLRIAKKINEATKNQKIAFWINPEGLSNETSTLLTAIISIYQYGNSTVATDFPNMEKGLFGKPYFHPLQAASSLIIIAKNEIQIDKALKNLSQKSAFIYKYGQIIDTKINNENVKILELKKNK